MDMTYCRRHEYYFESNQCDKCDKLIEKSLETISFYANQLLDYNEVVSQELLADKGSKARNLLKSLKPKS